MTVIETILPANSDVNLAEFQHSKSHLITKWFW